MNLTKPKITIANKNKRGNTISNGFFIVLLGFLVGLGTCVGGGVIDSLLDKPIMFVQEARFVSKITKKVENNTATQEEYYVYSEMNADKPEIRDLYRQKAPEIINRQTDLNLANHLFDNLKRDASRKVIESPTLQQVIILNKKLVLKECYIVDYNNFGKPYFHLYTNRKEYIPLKFSSHFLKQYYGSKGTILGFKELPSENFLQAQLLSLYYADHCETDQPNVDRTARYQFSKHPEEFFKSDENSIAYFYTLEKILKRPIAPPSTNDEQRQIEKKGKIMAEKIYLAYIQHYPSTKYLIVPNK